jgi:hypothetical protein
MKHDKWQAERIALKRNKWQAEATRLRDLINTPELVDFSRAVHMEAVHQIERWGTNHDAGKTPADWFWLVGYLAGKALTALLKGDTDKALHHIITTAAALNNWHAQVLGASNMRPGLSNKVQKSIEEKIS